MILLGYVSIFEADFENTTGATLHQLLVLGALLFRAVIALMAANAPAYWAHAFIGLGAFEFVFSH
jgi:hypothetical protein